MAEVRRTRGSPVAGVKRRPKDGAGSRAAGSSSSTELARLSRRYTRLQNKKIALEVEVHELRARVSELESSIQNIKRTKNEEVAAAKDKANRDSLTGLYNTGKFRRTVRDYVVEAMRDRRGLQDRRSDYAALWVIDLDNFKSINDLVGHVGGDHVIQVASRIISRYNRGDSVCTGRMKPKDSTLSGVPGRIGGDEFGVFQRGLKRPMDAYLAADRVMREFAQFKWEQEELREFRPQMSIGVAVVRTSTLHPDRLEVLTFDSLKSYAQQYGQSVVNQWMHLADIKMYGVKSYFQVGVGLYDYNQDTHQLEVSSEGGGLTPRLEAVVV